MTTTHFASPEAVQDAVLICLASAFSEDEWDGLVKHKGAAGTGQNIDCCPNGLLRVETGPLQAIDERGRRWLARPNGCVDLEQTIIVTFRRCYSSVDRQGRTKTAVNLQEQGLRLQDHAWAAVTALKCCADYMLRFSSIVPDEPAACAGWTLTLDATIRKCAGAPCERPGAIS